MRSILKTIPFPRLRLAGDGTCADTLSVIPGRRGRKPSQGKGILSSEPRPLSPPPCGEEVGV
jgi:hypothetical protein